MEHLAYIVFHPFKSVKQLSQSVHHPFIDLINIVNITTMIYNNMIDLFMMNFLKGLYENTFSFRVLPGGKDEKESKESSTPTSKLISHELNDRSVLPSKMNLIDLAKVECKQEKSRSVTFHPSIVTGIYLRVSTSEEEKQDLYFSRNELRKCREEEERNEKARLESLIQGQQKYKKCGCRQGNIRRVSLKVSV